MTACVFHEDDESPEFFLNEDVALGFLELLDKIPFAFSDYATSDAFIDNRPLGFSGYEVNDAESGNYWEIRGKTVFKFDTKGVWLGNDDEEILEAFLYNHITEPIIKALATKS
jgi:hypothetical protein